MGAIPTVYRWDDTGAPMNPGSNNDYDQSYFVGQVLKACLVDGYGAKSPAGWNAYNVSWPTGSAEGRIIFENASMTGVADFRMEGRSARVEALAAGWDGSQLVDPVPYRYELSGNQTNIIDDARSARWCVVANDRACVMITWRDPTGLSGYNLSQFNSVAMGMGELLPVVPSFSVGAAPNFACFQARRMDGPEVMGDSNQNSSVISRVTAEGLANTYTGDSFHGHGTYGYSDENGDNRFSDDALAAPFLPIYIRGSEFNENLQFGRWPGLWLMAGVPSDQLLIDDRDVRGVWTGDVETVGGISRVLVTSRQYYGWVSLSADDWP